MSDIEATSPTPLRSRWLWGVAALGIFGAAIAAIIALRQPREEQFVPVDIARVSWPELAPDPRRTFESPFRNIRPEVAYVGDAACAGCHEKHDESFHQHPMGRSATTDGFSPGIERFDDAARTSFVDAGWRLAVDSENGRHIQRMSRTAASGTKSLEVRFTPHVTIGSGTLGRTYVEERGGEVWQTPISWFSTIHQWDVSPGASAHGDLLMPIDARCLGCHIQRVEMVPFSQHRLARPLNEGQVSIGCERCHGPGAIHVKERTEEQALRQRVLRQQALTEFVPTTGEIDTSIVNPKHLAIGLRMAICQQCHLSGAAEANTLGRGRDEFRPGMPLELFVSIFTTPSGETGKSVQQFEQMVESKCFTASNGKFDCVTCHDPHVKPNEQDTPRYFRERCQRCHDNAACGATTEARQAKSDSCIACHMPRGDSGSIAHASTTDHRVLRSSDQVRQRPSDPEMLIDKMPVDNVLVESSFGESALPPDERRRNRAIALARILGERPPGEAIPAELLQSVGEILRQATASHPNDHDAWLARSTLAQQHGDVKQALADARQATAAVEYSEIAWRRVAELALALQDRETADASTAQLMRLHPQSALHLRLRGESHRVRQSPQAAVASFQKAIALHPLDSELRLLEAIALQQAGRSGEAEQSFAMALSLTSDTRLRNEYRQRFSPRGDR